MYKPESSIEEDFLDNYNPADYPITMVTVDVIILRTGQFGREIALIKRGGYPYKGRWALPGGFMESHESAILAARREVTEEVGLRLDSLKLDGIADRPDRDPRGRAVSIVFLADADGELNAGDDASDARWFTLGAAKDMALAFDHNELIARL